METSIVSKQCQSLKKSYITHIIVKYYSIVQNRHSQSGVCLLDMEKFGLVLSDDEVDDDECFSITVNTSTHTHTRIQQLLLSLSYIFQSHTGPWTCFHSTLFRGPISVSFCPSPWRTHSFCFGNRTRAQLSLREPKNRKMGKQQKTFSN